jgi:biopolymer transport protein TolQ
MAYINILAAGLTSNIWQIVGETTFFGKIILAILVAFSIVSWSIMFNKWRTFKKVDRENFSFLQRFRTAAKMSSIVEQVKGYQFTPLTGLFLQGYDEVSSLIAARESKGMLKSDSPPLSEKETEILSMTLDRVTLEQIQNLERKVVFLATTANASPFLGLLGTVVGIMDAFWEIGQMQSASLAVVAGPIAEALLATLVGLAAAIPAVIGYNWATNKLKYYFDFASNFALEFEARIKKDLT